MRDIKHTSIVAGIISSLFIFFEVYTNFRDFNFKEIEMSTVDIIPSSVNRLNNGKFVYFQSNNISFKPLEDPLFGVSRYAGKLEKHVEYCQWVQTKHTKTKRGRNGEEKVTTYTYSKMWVNYPINSLFFHNPLYNNPTINIEPNDVYKEDVYVDSFTIKSDISYNGKMTLYVPDLSETYRYGNLPKSSEFVYTNKGIFYRPYKPGLLQNLMKIGTFFDRAESKVSLLSSWCEPGDTRVWFNYWTAKNVTVLGIQHDNLIESTDVKGFQIGSLYNKFTTLEEIIKSNKSLFPDVMLWISRVSVLGYLIYFYVNFKSLDLVFFSASVLLFALASNSHYFLNFQSIWLNIAASLVIGLLVLFCDQWSIENIKM